MTYDPLSAALFGKTRQAVLALLLCRPDESFYLREVVRLTKVGQGAVQRELQSLVNAGILRRSERGRQVFFRANEDCPIFRELQGIMVKTAGVVDVLRQVLKPLARQLSFAFLYGSIARGTCRKSSDVDICVIGDTTFSKVVSVLGPAQERLSREVNPTVYPLAEFSTKLRQEHHFVTTVSREPKIFVIGDERDFTELAEQWVARSTPGKFTGSRRPSGRRRSRSD